MKKIILILALAAAVLLAACTSSRTLEDRRMYVSWTAFCATYGYHADEDSDSIINEYLDAWCGSVQEEEAFIMAGVKPY